ncbi:MAG: 2-oxo acid dehydrogenase subunit E2 [Oligoflexia bacterium]|nr:2-oxo acid dehydrogenase subunit E2 [Oligoflexia bacterium]
MATEIKMPQLSDTMNAGKILTWRKSVGDSVKRGDVLAEVETEKANLEIESFHEGVLLKILVPGQATAKVGEVIAVVGQAGEQVGAITPTAVTQAPTLRVEAATSPRPSTPVAVASSTPASTADGRIKVSPLARRLAQERNIDLSIVRGSGPEGRIVRKDIEQAQGPAQRATSIPTSTRTTTATPTNVARDTSSTGGSFSTMSKMRETIARRMQESVREAPHFYVTTDINMREAIRLRETLKERPDFKGISLNHLIIKAAAYALAHEPRVNCAVRDGQVYTPDQINIGIITAIEDGLLIPVVRSADTLALKDLVFESRAAVERARAGRPSSSDLVGGTFSISNMGMFDVENFTAIINPGQGAVLAVSSVRDVPVVENGCVVPGVRMKATLSVDHRIIDGVMAGTFQRFLKQALETPALLLL